MAETNGKYDLDALVQLALDEGFSRAARVNMESLVCSPSVRELCSMNRCRCYGKRWRCPPACGTLEEAAERIRQYSCGILVQSIGYLENEYDNKMSTETAAYHGELFVSIMRKLKAQYGDVFGMGAGTCSKCVKCTYPDAPCRYPEDSYSSMEAYGVKISRVCECSGLPYLNDDRTVTYASCFLLK